MVGRIGFLVVVRRRLADPFQKTPLADDRNTKGRGTAKLVGGTAIVKERPAELADNEDLRTICDLWAAVVELGRIEVAGFCLDDMSGEIEHLFRSLELGNVLEIRQLVANFLRRPCRRQHSFELPPYSFKGAAQLDDDGTVRQVRAVHVVR